MSYSQAFSRAQRVSAKRGGCWLLIVEAGDYHVLSELEAFDLWCVHDHQICASFIDGELLED